MVCSTRYWRRQIGRRRSHRTAIPLPRPVASRRHQTVKSNHHKGANEPTAAWEGLGAMGETRHTSSVSCGVKQVNTAASGRPTVDPIRSILTSTARTLIVAALIVMADRLSPAIAQTANSNAGLEGGQDNLFDAILATPNQKTPVLQDNVFATAPGLGQVAPAPQFTLNALAPALFNSNAQFLSSGGSKAFEGSPLVRLGWASQLFDTPIRVSGAASFETERFVMPPAPLSTTSALPHGRNTSILKTTRTIRPSCPMCRDWISTPPSRTTSLPGRTSISASTRCSTSTAPLTGFRLRPTARARRCGRLASASGRSSASATRALNRMRSFSTRRRHTSFPTNGTPASRCQ